MSSADKKLENQLKNLNVRGNQNQVNSNDISESDEDKLLKADSPSNSDIMGLLRKVASTTIDTKTAINTYIAKNNKRVAAVEAKAEETDAKVDALASKITKFENNTSSMNHLMEMQKQQQLKNNITLMNIPLNSDLDLSDTMISIASKMDVLLQKSDIASIYRVKGSRNNLVVAKFVTSDKKIEIMNKSKSTRLKVSDCITVETPDSTKPIYVNQHLTPYFAKLLQKGRSAVTTESLVSCWIVAGGLMVKAKDNSEPKLMQSIDDIERFIIEVGLSKPTHKTNDKSSKRNKPDDTTSSAEKPSRRPRRKN